MYLMYRIVKVDGFYYGQIRWCGLIWASVGKHTNMVWFDDWKYNPYQSGFSTMHEAYKAILRRVNSTPLRKEAKKEIKVVAGFKNKSQLFNSPLSYGATLGDCAENIS